MLPMMIDPKKAKIALLGDGRQAVARLSLLDESGAQYVRVFSPNPNPNKELVMKAGKRFAARLPDENDIKNLTLLFATQNNQATQKIIQQARRYKVLVNLEDVNSQCDFFVPARVRRGDLLLAIGTSGHSPALAKRIKATLETYFPPDWAKRLEQMKKARLGWHKEGLSKNEIINKSNALIDEKKWLV